MTREESNEIVATGQLVVGILGNPETSDFELIDLGTPLPVSHIRAAHESRGMYFLGVAGIVNGAPRSALEEPLDHATVSALARAYLLHVLAGLNKRLAADGQPLLSAGRANA